MRRILIALIATLFCVSIAEATTPIFFSGFETGDTSEWTSNVGTTVVTTPVTLGGYAMKAVSTNGGGGQNVSQTISSTSTIFARFSLYIASPFPASQALGNQCVMFVNNNCTLSVPSDGSGNPSLQITYDGSASGGVPQAISTNTYYTVEEKFVASASGSITLRINGAQVDQLSRDTTGIGAATSVQFGMYNLGAGGSATAYIDDVMLRTDVFPGIGYILARQGNTTAPNYDTWTKSTGSIWNVWDDTPFNAATNASSATSGNKQTMVVDFTTTGGTGSTGHGTGTVGSSDQINAFKVSVVGKTSSTTTDGVDSTIFRTPAGGGGVDTTTALSAWTTGDTYKETILATTPSAANVRSAEVGLSKGTGTNTHTAEDVWAMVDDTPANLTPSGASTPSIRWQMEVMSNGQ